MLRVLALLAPLAVSSAQAQTPPAPGIAADRALIATCLRQSGQNRDSCIGAVAVACVRGQSGDRVAAEVGCARREEAVWRERLGIAGQALLRTGDATRRSQFAALQIAWEGYVAQKCAFYGVTLPPARAPGLRAGCEVREVARRVLELERAASVPQPRRPSGPPQIIR